MNTMTFGVFIWQVYAQASGAKILFGRSPVHRIYDLNEAMAWMNDDNYKKNRPVCYRV